MTNIEIRKLISKIIDNQFIDGSDIPIDRIIYLNCLKDVDNIDPIVKPFVENGWNIINDKTRIPYILVCGSELPLIEEDKNIEEPINGEQDE